jgi:hypothetical protein
MKDDADRANDFAFGYIRCKYDDLKDRDYSLASEFGGVLLTQTAVKGVAHVRDTLNRVQ